MAAPANSRVLAVAAGTVVASGYGFNGEGNYAEIDHGNGIHTIYMHLIASPVVKKRKYSKSRTGDWLCRNDWSSDGISFTFWGEGKWNLC